jgi:hypothetical protein
VTPASHEFLARNRKDVKTTAEHITTHRSINKNKPGQQAAYI